MFKLAKFRSSGNVCGCALSLFMNHISFEVLQIVEHIVTRFCILITSVISIIKKKRNKKSINLRRKDEVVCVLWGPTSQCSNVSTTVLVLWSRMFLLLTLCIAHIYIYMCDQWSHTRLSWISAVTWYVRVGAMKPSLETFTNHS